jgi:hypothetical protein
VGACTHQVPWSFSDGAQHRAERSLQSSRTSSPGRRRCVLTNVGDPIWWKSIELSDESNMT